MPLTFAREILSKMEIDREDIHQIHGIMQLIDSIDLNDKVDAMIKYAAITQLLSVAKVLAYYFAYSVSSNRKNDLINFGVR